MNAFQRQVRAAVYAGFRESTEAPAAADLAATLSASPADVIAGLRELGDEHCLVLSRDGESIRMAHPFSGIPTNVTVTVDRRRWFANCVWDGLSIIGLMGDGRVDTSCGATGDAMTFHVAGGVVSGGGIVHFLVPAARFWDDIVYT